MARFGVSYFGVRDPRHARRDLDEIAEAGFTSVTHTLSEHDLRYHLDDVGLLIEETRSRGLEAALDPWGVGGLFGGEAYPEIALVDLDSRQVNARGESVPAACPCAPATRALLERWARSAASLGPDLLFWDEPHWYLGALRADEPAPCCRCAHCEAAWSAGGVGGPLPAENEPALGRFREAALREALGAAVVAAGDGPAHSVCLLPRGEFRGASSDEWATFADLPGLRRLGTDPYWMDRPVEPAAYVRTHAAALREICNERDLEMEIWIQGILIAAGDEDRITTATEAALQCGADVVSYWSFRGTERMSRLACGDPDAAWSAMCEAARRWGT